jgi:hypothetical protein
MCLKEIPMKKIAVATLLLVLTLGTAACGLRALSAPDAQYESFQPGIVSPDQPIDVLEMAVDSRGMADDSFSAYDGYDEEVLSERMITRNANLTIVVTDPAQSIEDIGEMARSMDGFVVTSNVYIASYGEYGESATRAQYASITIRVPSERLDEALAQLKADAVEVRNEYVSGEDITQEFIDNESRLRNLEAAEAQLLEIMEDASDTEDVLNVFTELTRIRSEIEVIRGRLQYLQQSADTSSISIELIPDVATQPIEVERWQLQATFNKAVEALVGTVQFLVRAVIWLVIYVLPFGLVIALVLWLVIRAIRKRSSKAESK